MDNQLKQLLIQLAATASQSAILALLNRSPAVKVIAKQGPKRQAPSKLPRQVSPKRARS